MTASATLNEVRRGQGSTAMGGRRPKRRRWVRLLLVLLVLALLGTGGWLVEFSSVLTAQRVTVTGAKTSSAADIRAAAQVPIGKPLARQDPAAIAARVASLKPIRSVLVSRSWPRTMTIAVQERSPVLALPLTTGFALVDEVGFAYRNVPEVPVGVVLADADPSDAAVLSQIGMVASALPPELKHKVRKIQAYSPDAIKLHLNDGDVVIWGSSTESALKSQVVLALLHRKAQTYNVSAPHSPTLR